MDAHEEALRWKNLAMRYKADLENNNRRLIEEQKTLYRERYRPLLEEILPIIDDLEAALECGYDHPALLNGVQQIVHKLYHTLNLHGAQPLNPHGERFDPSQHEAIAVREENRVPPDTILEVARKGWTLHDRLIRPPLVVTSK